MLESLSPTRARVDGLSLDVDAIDNWGQLHPRLGSCHDWYSAVLILRVTLERAFEGKWWSESSLARALNDVRKAGYKL